MSGSISQSIRKVDMDTRVQYALMILFGGLCLVAAVAPLAELTQVALVGTLFGFTAGLWVSHLVGIVHNAVKEKNASVAKS